MMASASAGADIAACYLERGLARDPATLPTVERDRRTAWRRLIFGDKAIDPKRGRLALAVENGKVVTFDGQDAEPAVGE